MSLPDRKNVQKTLLLFLVLCLQNVVALATGQTDDANHSKSDTDTKLLDAARAGDLVLVQKLIEGGADVNTKNRYNLTALYYAADRGAVDVVRVLLAAGAETEIPNEPYYRLSPMIMAARKNHAEVVKLMLDKGASCGPGTATWPASLNHTEVVQVLVENRPDVFKQSSLDQLAKIAKSNDNKKLLDFLIAKGATPAESKSSSASLEPALTKVQQGTVDGIYINKANSEKTRVWARRGKLYFGNEFDLASELTSLGGMRYQIAETPDAQIRFVEPLGNAIEIRNTSNADSTDSVVFKRLSTPAIPGANAKRADFAEARWTRFRGHRGAGIADGLNLPAEFDATTGKGLAWKSKIPGMGHSSPVIWNNQIFVTTAIPISDDPKYDLRVASGFDTHVEEIDYRWIAYSFDLATGEKLWETKLCKGRPRSKRHIMSSHANCTPAVDSAHLIINLAGQGIYCLTHKGDIKWKKDLGKLANGWFMDPGYEWGFASSPVLFKSRIYVQCDIYDGSFLAVFDAANGDEIWRTKREEISSWGTPLIIEKDGVLQVVANGTRAICGYDAADGSELWRIRDNSEVTVASPIPDGKGVLVCGGYMPVQPIFSIDISERGDLTPPQDDAESGNDIETNPRGLQWWSPKGGAYGVTPIIYRGQLYILKSNGVVTSYDQLNGNEIYKKRIGRTGDIVASPIAADGNIYIVGGDGDVFVLSAGSEYLKPRICPVGEQVMASPAAAPDRLIIRGVDHLFCFTKAAAKEQAEKTTSNQ